MKLLVGLGNVGDKYLLNRHNIGWWFVDAVAYAYGVNSFQAKFSGVFAKVKIGGEDVVLLKPHTYMNESGRSIRKAMDFFKITADDVWVVHDDLDLAPLKVRIKQGGGEGGHNGLKSITQHLGTKDYRRLRIGIGHPDDKTKVSGYVLSNLSKLEEEKFASLCHVLADEVEDILAGDGNDVLSRLGGA